MKAVRISVLTMVLLAGATFRPVPTYDQNTPNEPHTLAQTPGPCYYINGVWICED